MTLCADPQCTMTMTCNVSRPHFPSTPEEALVFCFDTKPGIVVLGYILAAAALITYLPQWFKIVASGHTVGLSYWSIFCGSCNQVLSVGN